MHTPHRRPGLTAVVAGIAALGGAGTLAAVLPAPGSTAVHHHPVVVADAAALGLPASPTTTTPGTAGRTRSAAVVAGLPPAPSAITAIF